ERRSARDDRRVQHEQQCDRRQAEGIREPRPVTAPRAESRAEQVPVAEREHERVLRARPVGAGREGRVRRDENEPDEARRHEAVAKRRHAGLACKRHARGDASARAAARAAWTRGRGPWPAVLATAIATARSALATHAAARGGSAARSGGSPQASAAALSPAWPAMHGSTRPVARKTPPSARPTQPVVSTL